MIYHFAKFIFEFDVFLNNNYPYEGCQARIIPVTQETPGEW